MNKVSQQNLVNDLVEALTWHLSSEDVILGFIEHFGAQEIIEYIDLEEMREGIGEAYKPDDIFTYDELAEWAYDNIDIDLDPPGYEERVRY